MLLRNLIHQILFIYLQFWRSFKTVRLILILLNFGNDFGHFPPLGEVDQVGVVKEVRVPLLKEQDVSLKKIK